MIPHDIDRERFDYLVAMGLTAAELRSFFKEKRQPLIMCGVKVQNQPSNPAAAKALIQQFNDEAHRVFGSWIQELEDRECSVGPDQWIPRYRAVEELRVSFPREDMAAMARAGLKELYKKDPRRDWIQFLSTPPIGDAQPVESRCEFTMPDEQEWLTFVKWLCGLVDLDGVTSPVLRDAAAIVAEWDQRNLPLELASTAGRRTLPLIKKTLEESRNSAKTAPARRGLHAKVPATRAREEDVDYLALPLLATRVSSPRSGPYMANVDAFVDESGPFRLGEEELCETVKTLGRVAIFPDRGFSQPPWGEAVMYKVESHATHLPVQVRVKEIVDTGLLRVVRLPHSANEAHLIRREIEQYARTDNVRPTVFITTDELCLKPAVDPLVRVTTRDYDWVLDTWEYLEGTELASGTYVLAPLPPPTGKLSCAPLAAAAGRLLRNRALRSQANLTKAQANVLKDLLLDESLGVDDLSRKRLEENIGLIAVASEDYDELVGLLMEAPPVKADIERRIAARVAELDKEREKEIEAIADLKRQREAAQAKLKTLRAETNEKVKAVRTAVAQAFARASAKEIEALGEASVLWALLGHDTRWSARKENMPSDPDLDKEAASGRPVSPTVVVRRVAASKGSISDVIRTFGISAETSERLSRVLRTAVSLGLPIVTKGSGARQLAQNLGYALSSGECVVCEIPVGLVENARLETQFGVGDGGGVLILDANLSDFSVYAPGLLDELVTGALGGKGVVSARPFVLSLSSGPAGLFLPAELDDLGVELNLDTLGNSFASDDRVAVRPQGVLANRVLKRLDADPAMASLEITPTVVDDLAWLLCQHVV